MNTLPIPANELAHYCVTSFDKLPPMYVSEQEYDDQHLYQLQMHERLKVHLVKLYGSILLAAHGVVSTVLLMEHVLAEAEDLMSRNHPHSRCPFIDMTDALEYMVNGFELNSRRRWDDMADDILHSSLVGSFLKVRAHRRVGTAPVTDGVMLHNEFTLDKRINACMRVVDELCDEIPDIED